MVKVLGEKNALNLVQNADSDPVRTALIAQGEQDKYEAAIQDLQTQLQKAASVNGFHSTFPPFRTKTARSHFLITSPAYKQRMPSGSRSTPQISANGFGNSPRISFSDPSKYARHDHPKESAYLGTGEWSAPIRYAVGNEPYQCVHRIRP